MGSRIGYRVICNKNQSDILRQQWATGIEEGIQKMWNLLADGRKVYDGSKAIRDDLDIARGFASLVVAFYHAPFDSIEKDEDCDIDDNGLIVVDISQFDRWRIIHTPSGTHIANMDKEGFKWFIDKGIMDSLGEGLF